MTSERASKFEAPHDIAATPSAGAFVGGLGDAARAALLRCSCPVSLQRHEVLLRQGRHVERLVILTCGRARATAILRDGHAVHLRLLRPQDVIGLPEALSGVPASTTVTMLADGSGLACSAADLRGLAAAHHSVAAAAAHDLARTVLDLQQVLLRMADGDAVARVATTIIELMQAPAPPSTPQVHPIVRGSQADLATWAALSRETTVRALRALRREGAIATRRNTIVVLDERRLAGHC